MRISFRAVTSAAGTGALSFKKSCRRIASTHTRKLQYSPEKTPVLTREYWKVDWCRAKASHGKLGGMRKHTRSGNCP